MIKLDKWDSQLVWYSKGWLKEEIPLKQVLKNIWSNRCGVYTKHVEIARIAEHLLKLLISNNFFCNRPEEVIKIVGKLAPRQWFGGDNLFTENDQYFLKICELCFDHLSSIKVQEKEEILISLYDFEPQLLTKGLKEKNED